MKQLTKQSLSKNEGILDKLWRSVNKLDYCEICATLPVEQRINYTQIHPHHIIGRGHHITRWDLLNRIWLCPTHHTLGRYSAHQNALWFASWMREIKPDIYEYLQRKQHLVKNWTLDELLVIYNELSKEVTRKEI